MLLRRFSCSHLFSVLLLGKVCCPIVLFSEVLFSPYWGKSQVSHQCIFFWVNIQKPSWLTEKSSNEMNLLISVFHFSPIIWYFYAGKIHLRCFPFQCFHFLNRSQDARGSACRKVSLVTSVPHSQEDRFASLLMEDTLWAETLMNCQRHYIAWHGHADLGHMDLVKIVVWWKSQSLCCVFLNT